LTGSACIALLIENIRDFTQPSLPNAAILLRFSNTSCFQILFRLLFKNHLIIRRYLQHSKIQRLLKSKHFHVISKDLYFVQCILKCVQGFSGET
jgi:hypothetical protein